MVPRARALVCWHAWGGRIEKPLVLPILGWARVSRPAWEWARSSRIMGKAPVVCLTSPDPAYQPTCEKVAEKWMPGSACAQSDPGKEYDR